MNFISTSHVCWDPANGSYMGYRPRPERVKALFPIKNLTEEDESDEANDEDDQA